MCPQIKSFRWMNLPRDPPKKALPGDAA